MSAITPSVTTVRIGSSTDSNVVPAPRSPKPHIGATVVYTPADPTRVNDSLRPFLGVEATVVGASDTLATIQLPSGREAVTSHANLRVIDTAAAERYYASPDGYGTPTIWRDSGDGRPMAVLTEHTVGDPALWAHIVATLPISGVLGGAR